ncbi:MAG: EamA family transporter [Victivallales bacterium]|nr:EamA family transporter [Victivallales bacterium]MBT7163157.1 EamA family transporter [Victivallales bacterium]MBT7300107.1 EamA family transporter [Victivallales bacterium]
MKDSSHALRGWLALLGAIFLFSTIEIASKELHDQVPTVNSMVVVFLRFFITGVALIGLSWRRIRRELRLGAKDYGLFALNGIIGISVGITLFHVAIVMMDKAASAAVVFSANPVFVTLLAPFINREKWTAVKIGGVLLGAVGVTFFAWESGTPEVSSVQGLAVMLLSAFCFALSICISKRIMPRYGATVVMGFSAMFGSLFLLPFIAFRLPISCFTSLAPAWPTVLYLAVIGTTVAYGLYYYGIHNTSAQGGSMSFFLKPVLASILAIFIRGETINGYMSAGTFLILLGLFLAEIVPKLWASQKPARIQEPVSDG